MLSRVTWTIVRFLHLLAVAVWIGGQAALFLVVPVIRERVPDASAIMGVVGRRFGAVAGPALVVILVTGMLQADHLGLMDVRQVREKMGLLALIVVLTVVHAVLGVRIARAGAGGERLRRTSRRISAVNLLLGVAALFVAADLAT
jgi:uncharacterized membrane protein